MKVVGKNGTDFLARKIRCRLDFRSVRVCSKLFESMSFITSLIDKLITSFYKSFVSPSTSGVEHGLSVMYLLVSWLHTNLNKNDVVPCG